MRRTLLAAVLLLAASCKRSEDEAARARMFSPEQPVGELPQAKEKIDAGNWWSLVIEQMWHGLF